MSPYVPHRVKIKLLLDRQPFEIMVLAPGWISPLNRWAGDIEGQVLGRETNKNRPHSNICALPSGALKCEVDDLFIQGQEIPAES